MSGILLVVWLSLIVADRVDFLAGHGPFLLSPFLVLTPLVLLSETLRLLRSRGRFRVQRETAPYALVVTLFLLVVGTSVILSRDQEFAVKRFALLVMIVYTTFLVCVALGSRPDADRILVRGSYLGLVVALVFNGLQAWAWQTHGGGHLFLLDGMVDVSPNMYGPWFPRLAGQVIDMNRSGILTVAYLFFIVMLAPPSRMRTFSVWTGVILILATVSRSVMLAGLTLWLAVALRDRRLGFSRRGIAAVMVVVGSASAWLIAHATQVQMLWKLAAPVRQRFDAGEGSAGVHVQLLERGWEVSSRSVGNALVGVGFGNSFHYTQDIFPGDKYGNFHSIYVTLLAESGVLALVLGIVLFFWPMGRSRRYVPLLAAFAAFNVFYQLISEPVFWFSLAAAWTGLCLPDRGTLPVDAAPPARPAELAELAAAPG